MNRLQPIRHVAAVLLAAGAAHAQVELFGPWHDLAPAGGTFELYVAPGGDDLTGAIGDPNFPFRTISRALEFALVDLQGAVPVTINIFPGNYVAGLAGEGEQFPLRMPTHGICLESIDVQDRANAPAAIIGGGGIPFQQGAILFIDSYGNPEFPDSVVRGLDFQPTDAPFAIRMNPGAGIPIDTAVQFRDNYIHGEQCQGGIDLQLTGARTSLEVLEGNWIVTERGQGGVVGVRIAGNSTVASPVLRSNQIARFESNVEISGGPENCRPRLCSNIIQVAERNVSIAGASPILINNTIAYAFNFTTQQVVTGIEGNGSVELINNLIWNPLTGSGATAAVDITGVNVQVRIATVDEDTAPLGFTPMFASGDTHPGLAVFGGLPPCKDLHLALGSQLIDAGDPIAALAVLANPPFPASVINGVTVRRDVNLDVDRDPRMLDGPGGVLLGQVPDIGADEVTDTTLLARIAGVGAGNSIDECGSLRASAAVGGQLDHLTAVAITTPIAPGNIMSAFVFLGAGFQVDVAAGGGMVTNGGLFQNGFQPGIGQIALDLAPANAVLIGSNFQVGGGAFPVVIDTAVIPDALAEGELYLQALVGEVSPAGVLLNVRVSNRMYVELDR